MKAAVVSLVVIGTLVAGNLAAAAQGFGASDPAAEPAPMATSPAPRTAAKRARKPAAASLMIANQRDVALTELSLVSKARRGGTTIVARDLPAGARRAGKLPAGGCVYDVEGTFEDDSSVAISNVNLCKDKAINLVE